MLGKMPVGWPSATLKTNYIVDLNSEFKSKKMIYFQSDIKIHDHFAAPIQLQILSEKL